MTGFHEVLFPLDVALSSRGGPRRQTSIVTTGSGREERNQRWLHSRRRYDAGYGIKSLSAIGAVLSFFEERRGMLYGFRWRDRGDCRSGPPDAAPTPLDQTIGVGDGVAGTFQLTKSYGSAFAPYTRDIKKPVAGSIRIAVDGLERPAPEFSLDHSAGLITFQTGYIPANGAVVTAGYVFDVPVRFDTDYLEIDYAAFNAGEIPRIPIVEIAV
jgi:uncharacterized protein (TIGR02217 family)